ncbi:hypothetical protein WCE10_22005, partial [Cronobacter muytjensii]|uniref:hypothetical protein n=1 Tax=Cronobacter muytjensii TaxID=413501 RepID=UPI0034D71630
MTLDPKALQSTLGVLSKDSEGYASARDQMADRYQTAIAVGELADITDAALSSEELGLKQLQRLREIAEETFNAEMDRMDSIIEIAQRQLDSINGNVVATMSVV